MHGHAQSHAACPRALRTSMSTRTTTHRPPASSLALDDPRHHPLRASRRRRKAARLAAPFNCSARPKPASIPFPIEQVHFHEVGAVDTIVDIVCAAAGAAALERGSLAGFAAQRGQRHGGVRARHTARARARHAGAARQCAHLLRRSAHGARHSHRRGHSAHARAWSTLRCRRCALHATGYGAGGRETAGQPNVLRLLVGEDTAVDDPAIEPIAVIETVIDDSTPQLLAYVSELLLAAGAWDVYRVPVQMKKGRTGVQLTVLCSPELVPRAARPAVPRDHHHRPALAHRKQDFAGARVRAGRNPVGPGADEDRALAHRRNRQRFARIRRLPQTRSASIPSRSSTSCRRPRACSPLTREGASMNRAQIEALLNEVRDGHTDVDEAMDRLRGLPFEDLGFAKLDHHRALRTGMPEVIFASGKTPRAGGDHLRAHGRRPAATCWPRAPRASASMRCSPRSRAPSITKPRAPSRSRRRRAIPGKGTVAVVCAGTSDLPIAEEAAVTARLMGNTVELIADVGRGRHSSPAGAAHIRSNPRACSSCARAWRARCPRWSAAW